MRKIYSRKFAREKGLEFLRFPNLFFESVTYEIIKKAHDLMDAYALKPRDAIDLSTALKRNLDEIITFDSDFNGITEIRFSPP